MSKRIRLIHWHSAEGRKRAAKLREAGYRVAFQVLQDPSDWKKVQSDVADAFVIDLDRLPSQGRDVGLGLRKTKATRWVPLVFVGGEPQFIERVKKILPDAGYASWRGIRGALTRAMAKPSKNPTVPASTLAGYSGTPLPKKLGIKPGATVALVDSPRDFAKTLGVHPDGLKLKRRKLASLIGAGAKLPSDHQLTIWFTRRRHDLERSIRRMSGMADSGPMWIAWPKKTSPLAADFSETDVRATGLAIGLVDYKICAIDADWSGLLFAWRKKSA